MMFWKKLQNPYALVAQGFLFGGLLYFATHVDSLEAAPASPPAASLLRSADQAR